MSSFIGAHTTVDLKGFEVVTIVRRLAEKEHTAALSQFACRVSAVLKFVRVLVKSEGIDH